MQRKTNIIKIKQRISLTCDIGKKFGISWHFVQVTQNNSRVVPGVFGKGLVNIRKEINERLTGSKRKTTSHEVMNEINITRKISIYKIRWRQRRKNLNSTKKPPSNSLPPLPHTLNIEQKDRVEIDLLLNKKQWVTVRFRDKSKIEVQLHTRNYACGQDGTRNNQDRD